MPHWWIQADCVLIEASNIQEAFQRYRDLLARAEIACSQGQHCSAMHYYAQVNPAKFEALLAKQDGDW